MKKIGLPKFTKKLFNPGLILVLLFLLLIGVEAYVLYYKVYGNLSTGIEDVAVDVNIVRLDLNNYNKMVELLDSLNSYQPANTPYENPFQ